MSEKLQKLKDVINKLISFFTIQRLIALYLVAFVIILIVNMNGIWPDAMKETLFMKDTYNSMVVLQSDSTLFVSGAFKTDHYTAIKDSVTLSLKLIPGSEMTPDKIPGNALGTITLYNV